MPCLEANFEPFYRKMKTEKLPQIVIDNFKYYYHKLTVGQTGLIPETEIIPLDSLANIEALPPDNLIEIGLAKLRHTVVIKLNGGLGTSMGMKRAKSLLHVKNALSFLDIIVRQTQNKGLPVVFMNSFASRDDTLEALNVYPDLHVRDLPLDFLQHKVPKVDGNDLSPAECPQNPKLEWCPPGHGDIYPALVSSGMLAKLIETGYEYAFVSNSDNLGAVPDPAILSYFIQKGLPFMMEVADRTEGDKKGGHLAQLKSGRYVLREIAQCPQEDQDAFQDIHRHRYFNTNNIWPHLPSLKHVMDGKKGVLELPMIRNRKSLDPRDPESEPVYQLETAMGAAISVFEKAVAIRVPRTRFIPVKNINDLMAVRSDRYNLNDKFELVPNPNQTSPQIRIDLDPAYYNFIDNFEIRFPVGIPSLAACESLTVKGDFRFGRDVILDGQVVLLNDNEQPFPIEDRRRIQGRIQV